ncbi:hypothetical protein MKEN_00379800 [Mycena kentingensis (nom. inval.)]|nr:hypothetical protein MKEN_00379800 [Mycena kentingensis (nom. inval.)]
MYTLLLTLAALSVSALARNTQPHLIAGYIPKDSLSYIGIAAYGASAIIHWIHFFAVRPRKPFLLYLNFGMTAMAVGFGLRILYSADPFSLGKYIATTLFTLLSPCLFLATDYILLSQLVLTFPREIAERCLLIRQSFIVKIFVWSDVTTFILQSAGGSMAASDNITTVKVGDKIALVGVVAQAVSFLLFTVVFIVFGWRLFSTEPIQNWPILFWVVCVTCVGIIIRSVFRAVEFAGGYSGPVRTTEVYFYTLDALPLWISMTLYCFVWPARVLNRTPVSGTSSLATIEMDAAPGKALA